jgi:hypothetical protein
MKGELGVPCNLPCFLSTLFHYGIKFNRVIFMGIPANKQFLTILLGMLRFKQHSDILYLIVP